MLSIKQGEIWLVKFNPQVGNEISKTRLAVVIDENIFDKLKTRLVMPVTSWQGKFSKFAWYVKVENYKNFGLDNLSAFDCRQLKSFSHQRFVKKIGQIDEKTLFQIHQTITKIFNFRYHLSKL